MTDITRLGVDQLDLVTLLERSVGRAWIPVSSFNDIGGAEYARVGVSTPYAMAFDKDADEHIDVAWLVPKNMDVTKAASIYVYWSSVNTAGKDCTWDIDYSAVALGEDVGAAVSNMTAGIDTDSGTADDLNIGPAITLPADTFAATGEVLFMSLFRDIDAADDLAADAHFHGLRIDYTCLPSISTSEGANITRVGLHQGDLVNLLDKTVGQLWVPVSEFNDIGGAQLSAVIGSGKAVGMLFDPTTDEHIDVTLLVPENMDVTKAASIYVYWSSGNTSSGKECTWNIDYSARTEGEDVGVAVANISAGADTDSEDANDLNVSPAMALPADTFASTDELFFLSLFRDVDESDDLSVDAVFYGIRIDYTCKPSISTTVGADIMPTGMLQGDMVTLLDRTVGKLWVPISKFSDNGAGTLVATGGVRAVGMTFATGSDEAIEVALLVPKNMDVAQPMSIYVYWSAAGTGAEDCQWDADYIAIAADDDIGDTVLTVAATADDNVTTADILQIAPVITIPADTFASTAEVFFLSLRRDVSDDDLATDASVYGIRIDYTCSPSISS